MLNNQIQNIERAVIATIIFEPEHIDYIESLNVKEFTMPEHQQIFAAMKSLYDNNKPVTEDFILKIAGNEYEHSMTDIMLAIPVSNLEAYIVDIRTNFKKKILRQGLASLVNINEDTNIQQTLNSIELLLNKVEI